jgi:signal transduction histidine kinase/CheY-like chemotaxis protein/HAMP domain-containing protein
MSAERPRRRVLASWVDLSIHTKGLVVIAVPVAMLLVLVVVFSATADRNLLAAAIVAVILGIGAGFVAMRLFTDGVVARLRRLERATLAVEEGRPVDGLPDGNDEIGRLAARLAHSTAELAARGEDRDRARDQLEEILTASPIVSLRYDEESKRFTYASPNVDRLLGVSAVDALADPDALAERFHPEDRERLSKALRDGAVGRGDRVSLELRFRRDPDAATWGQADTVCTPDIGADGTIVGAVVYLVDVSERHIAERAAEERRFMLESIFHASPDTITVRDDRGRVVLASTSLAEVMVTEDDGDGTGAGAGGVPGAGGAVSAEGRRLIDELAARCAAGARDMGPVVTSGRAPDGTVRLFETRARPVLDEFGTVTGTVTISRDITERIRLEDSLRDATTAAERASEAKSEFLSRMSHELRTPLNAILGFAQLLELDGLPDDQAASVDQIQKAGRHLLSLINEVLDIARIEAGRLTIDTTPVDVADVLLEVTTLLTPVAEAVGSALSIDSMGAGALRVHADRQRLLQVLLNLGSNALKYGGAQGSVAFRMQADDHDNVRFEVTDTGPGIPRDKQDELWVPFARLGAERTRVEGTGVGLALSKHLVELMGGAIGVRSRPGRGATFWITLRRAAEPAPTGEAAGDATRAPVTVGAPGASSPAPLIRENGRNGSAEAVGADAGRAGRDAHGSRALLVLQIEDNPSNASLVAQVLGRRPNVRLLSASTAREGLDLAADHPPDLVLLDLHLPDLPGDEVVRRLKESASLADTKIVVVSADATPSRIRRMLDLGVDGYLTKPVAVEALLRLVDRELEDQPS